MSRNLQEFLSFIGEVIDLQGFTHYNGGLDVKGTFYSMISSLYRSKFHWQKICLHEAQGYGNNVSRVHTVAISTR